jgi:hypothetical protein
MPDSQSFPAKSILFNGFEIQGVSPFAGHDDHLHVHFKT